MRQLQSKRAFGVILFSLLPALLAVLGVSPAFSQAPFYQGKTITLIAETIELFKKFAGTGLLPSR